MLRDSSQECLAQVIGYLFAVIITFLVLCPKKKKKPTTNKQKKQKHQTAHLHTILSVFALIFLWLLSAQGSLRICCITSYLLPWGVAPDPPHSLPIPDTSSDSQTRTVLHDLCCTGSDPHMATESLKCG